MTTPVISTLAQLESTLKLDLIQTVGTPVLTFLSSMNTIATNLAANAQPGAAEIAEAAAQSDAAWIVLGAGILGSLPNLGAEAIVAVTSFCTSQLQSKVTPAPAASAAAK